MYRKQISLCFILGLLICLTQAKARCLVYERELNLSADWENCKVQCTKESCVSWRYENETNRCFGKMVEIVVSQGEHKTASENSTDCTNLYSSIHSSTPSIEESDAEGSISGNEKEEEDIIREIEIKDDEGKDSNEEIPEYYYAQFYNTHIPVMRDDDDHADDNSDEQYDEQYDDYGTNVPKAASEERTPQEETHAEYYNQFYNEDLSDTSD